MLLPLLSAHISVPPGLALARQPSFFLLSERDRKKCVCVVGWISNVEYYRLTILDERIRTRRICALLSLCLSLFLSHSLFPFSCPQQGLNAAGWFGMGGVTRTCRPTLQHMCQLPWMKMREKCQVKCVSGLRKRQAIHLLAACQPSRLGIWSTKDKRYV